MLVGDIVHFSNPADPLILLYGFGYFASPPYDGFALSVIEFEQYQNGRKMNISRIK